MGDLGIVCERARAWAALEPDGELSSFEQRLLAAHLERCEHCSTFAQQVAGATLAVRAAPLEPLPHPVPVSHVARHPRLAPRRARAGYPAIVAAAAAVMAVTIGTGVSIGGADESASPAPLVVVSNGDDRLDYQAMRQLRRLQLATDIAAPSSPSRRQFGARST